MTPAARALRLGLLIGVLLIPSRAVEASCPTFTVTGVTFGTYNVFTVAPLDSTGNIQYRCTGSQPISISLSKGTAPSFSPRTSKKGTEALNYNLFLDAACTSIWGDGTAPTSFYSDSNPANTTRNVTIFGRVTAGQDVTAGAYTDTIVATINF